MADAPPPESKESDSPSACGKGEGPQDGEGAIDAPLPDVPETSSAAAGTSAESRQPEVSASSTATGECAKLPEAHQAFTVCYANSRALTDKGKQKEAHCRCLETYVRSLRKALVSKRSGKNVLDDGVCGPSVRRTYYQTNASIGVVCPNSKDFDGSGAPCGMPGQKIFDARLIPNWVGIESKGFLLESFGITYRLGAIILGILSVVILIVCGFIIFMKMRKSAVTLLPNSAPTQYSNPMPVPAPPLAAVAPPAQVAKSP